ncbi:MAG: hypothetical protein ACR2L2_16935 [Acidobacteriota bacterium]
MFMLMNKPSLRTARGQFLRLAAALLAVALLPRFSTAGNFTGAPQQDTVIDRARAAVLKQKFLDLTEGWAREAVFTAAEQKAMEQGRAWEKQMMSGLEDPLGQKVLQAGEPSYQSVSAYYPGKVLDRTVLGTYSDPRTELPSDPDSQNEFAIWWNGAISARLLQGRLANVQPIAHNTNVLFRVGAAAEMFGKDAERYSRIRYEDGYLPIVGARYRFDGIEYEQTAFADQPEGETGGQDIAWVRFQMTNASPAPRTAELHADVILIDGTTVDAAEQRIVDSARAALLVHSDPRASFDGKKQRLSHRVLLAAKETAAMYFKIPYRPDSENRLKPAGRESFERSYRKVRDFWLALLETGMKIEVPEARVNAIWRALVLQNFVLADGPRFTYGSGLRYNFNYYPVENGLGGNGFAFYGFPGYSHALLRFCMPVSLDPKKAGRKYQNRRGVALHHLLQNYRLTRKLDVFREYKDDLFRVAEEIIADRRSTMVEENGGKPLHWGLLPLSLPAADDLGDKEPMYVPAHNITNCQGLGDFGRFLVQSGVDRARGEGYIREAEEFRKTILGALEKSVIRSPGRPPFVEIQTLYFRKTPGYGPEPYDDLALGRIQGTYYHYWVDMQLAYNFFDAGDRLGRQMTDYVQKMGGFVLGGTRARNRPDQPYGWINNVYNAGYYNYLLRNGAVDRFLLGFYSRLAYAMSRHVYVASEGSPFIGYNTRLGGFVSADYSFPNSAANSETLSMLRNMLVLEELKANAETGQIYLARGAPRAWFENGKSIQVTEAPTFFGNLSFTIESKAGRGVMTATVKPPARDPYKEIVISFRHPVKSPIRRVTVNGAEHRDFSAETVRLAHGPAEFRVEVFY